MKKYYVLPMFTYPSGFGLHVGHASNFSITDYVARKKKMEGYDVIYPTGFDSFGLPTENFAIKQGKSADEVTQAACKNFIEQMKDCDFDFDRDRLFLTSDPEYYKRTQRIFKKLFDHGLAYKKDGFVNRCNGCQTVLANDQVVDGKCERCETVIIQKKHPQWYLKITDYADQLIDDLDVLDWPEETKIGQRNWIGRSYGAEIDFVIEVKELKGERARDTMGDDETEAGKKYLIFDFDGVLGDTFESNTKVSMLIDNVDEEESRRRRLEYANNKPNHTKDHILSDDEFASLRAWLDNFAHHMSNQPFKLFDQFIEAIGKINNTQIAIVSSGMRSYIQPKLGSMPFEPTHVLTFEDHHSKEEKIAHICSDWGVSEKDVYYFTDTLADVYELEEYLDRTKLIGCPRGYCGRDQLLKVLPPEQILNEFEDVLTLFGEAKSGRLKAEGDNNATNEDVKNYVPTITVFTTRPDTIYGVTAVVLAPENQIIDHMLDNQKKEELAKFRAEVSLLTNIDRQSTERSKNGMDSGIFVRHPLTDELVPVRYADYVLMDYATGAVMFVPAHDERDWEFAKKYGIEVKSVIQASPEGQKEHGVITGTGVLINSDIFNGLDNTTAKAKITEYLELIGKGRKKTTFRLRDWSVSRQRYRGSPIPIYYTFEDNQKVLYFDKFDPQWTTKSDLEMNVRHLVYVLLKDTNSDRYCMLHWPDDLGISCICGGVEEEEDKIAAAGREAIEESGYQDISFVKQIGGEFHSSYYHPTKGKNFYSVCHAYLYEVDTSQKQELDPKEASKHMPVRMIADEIRQHQGLESTVLYLLDMLEGKQIELPTADRYNAYNPHPDKSKWIPHAIPEEDLPVVLPLDLPNYKPAGKSPLEDHPTFKYYHTKDGNTYLRECDTLDTFMCSSFYFLRFLDPKNSDYLLSSESAKYMPVDLYVGGKEHTVGHLIYARFIYKFLKDIGVVNNPSKEPFKKLVHQGMIHGADGRKMSKRRGNIIDPVDVIKEYNSDTLRTYLAFMGPVDMQKNWNPEAVNGVNRFLKRFEKMQELGIMNYELGIEGELRTQNSELLTLVHQTIKAVGEDIDNLKFNTAISKMMIVTNAIYDKGGIDKESLTKLVLLLVPFAPKLCQTMWTTLGQEGDVNTQAWPVYDPALAVNQTIEMPVQINGKTKGSLIVSKDIEQEAFIKLVTGDDKLNKYVNEGIKKVIWVPGKICNIIV